MRASVMNVVEGHFRPELINRIDEVVVFHALTKEHIAGIAKIQLQQLSDRLALNELSIQFSDAAVNVLLAEGYDPVYGARPLKRTIQRLVENPLAQLLLAGELMPSKAVHVGAKDGQLTFAAS